VYGFAFGHGTLNNWFLSKIGTIGYYSAHSGDIDPLFRETDPSDSRMLRFLQQPNAAGIKERRRLVFFRCLEELLGGEVGGVEGRHLGLGFVIIRAEVVQFLT